MTATESGPIQHAREIGQSLWLDYIRRDLVEDGGLARLIEAGEIRGVTSNPSIFQAAIGGSQLYDAAMRPLAHAGWSANQITESLAVHDIRAATDLFLPMYEGTGGRDGFVSIEVNPRLAADSEATLSEARRLWETVNRPNLMVKIPATPAGIPAIEQAISEGINVNVTLIFALERYAEVMEAYLRGLERREQQGDSLDRIASVASFFVSRVDTAVDRQLEVFVREEGPHAERAATLLGRAAVANAKLAYAQFKSVFAEPRFARLKERGARVQRPLWASTSTKNPAYSDVLYVDELIGPDTVNTLPPQTLKAFREHGSAAISLERDLSDARAQLAGIEGLGVSMQQVTLELEQAGVQAFTDAYDQLVQVVDQRAVRMREELGYLQPKLAPVLQRLADERVAARYWRRDASLWSKDAGTHALDYIEGWREMLPQVEQRVAELMRTGPARIAWLAAGGMGWPNGGSLELRSLETLDPADVRMVAGDTPIDSTVFIVASPLAYDLPAQAMYEAMWKRAQHRLGEGAAARFLVCAPEGSELHHLAAQRQLPFLAGEADVAGPLLAAALGGSAAELLAHAERMQERCAPHRNSVENYGLYLSALLATAAEAGVRRVGVLADGEAEAIADWLAGRLDRSALRERLAIVRGVPAEAGSPDRLLIYLRSSGERIERFEHAVDAGVPSVLLELEAGVGGEAVRWEMATGVATSLLKGGTSQPELAGQSDDRLAKEAERRRKGRRPHWRKPALEHPHASVWWSTTGTTPDPAEAVDGFAQTAAGLLVPGSVLSLGILRRGSQSFDRTLTDLSDALNQRGVDLRIRFGAMPPSSAAREGGGQLVLLLCDQPKVDRPVAGREYSLAELQQMQGQAAFETLADRQIPTGMLYFRPPATANNWLRSLIEATR